MTKQLNYKEFKEKQKNFNNNIMYILENFEHEENIGSAFRLADAFNVNKIIIVSNKEVSEKNDKKNF